MKRLFLAVVLMCVAASAHDMWLVTDLPGAEGKICARIGETFPGTVNGPTAERVTLFQFHSPEGTERLTGAFADKQFCAALPARDGIAEMVVHPRLNQIDSQRFQQFIRMEGLEEVVRQSLRLGGDGQVKYIYSRYSKGIIGRPPIELVRRPLGQVLEIVPQADPASLRSDSSFPVLVLFQGKPLANAQVAAVHEGASGETGSFPVVARTNSSGVAELKLTRGGLWYARLIYTIPANDPEFQWHHFFATLTFAVASSAEENRSEAEGGMGRSPCR